MRSGKFVTSEDGTKLWTDAVGDPSNPSVVFIPGSSSSSLIFDKQFEDPDLTKSLYLVQRRSFVQRRLLTRIFKVRYDVRGQGLSDQPLDPSAWTSDKIAGDFKAVVEAYGLKKPFIAAWYGDFRAYSRVTCADDLLYRSAGGKNT